VAAPTTLPAVAGVLLALAPAPITADALHAEVNRLAASVSAARHLPFRGPLPARAVGRVEFQAELGATLAAGLPGNGLGPAPRLLKRLGLIPAGADYAQLLAEACAAAPVPRYDPTTRRLMVPDFVPLEAQALPLAHEVAHAVADQRFGVRRLLQIAPDGSHRLDGDAERARLAIVEGDATLSALELADPTESFLDRRALGALTAGLRGAAAAPRTPPWLSALDRFEHVDGFEFVARVRARRPWSAVDALWSDPPASSAEVLHPERYEACLAPIPVPEELLPTLVGSGRPEASDVLGELVVRTWLAAALPPAIAARAAAGWAGDRAGIYQSAARTVTLAAPDAGAPAAPPASAPFAWLTLWDDGAEAEDFARAAEAAGVHTVARRGEAVALLLGVPEPDATATLAGMLDGWRREQAAARKAAARARRGASAGCARRDLGSRGLSPTR
jgi:antitoxin (DNA-binding transcriptional repressor) of toxin-antitoxin stability system